MCFTQEVCGGLEEFGEADSGVLVERVCWFGGVELINMSK